MSSFLKGRKLWRFVTGSISKPTKRQEEDDGTFWERLEDQDSKNHQILTWIRNTCIPSIKIQFTRFDTAQDVWDLLAKRYSALFNDFLSQMQAAWDQLALADPTWKNAEDAAKYFTYCDNLRLLHFLMALTREYEPV